MLPLLVFFYRLPLFLCRQRLPMRLFTPSLVLPPFPQPSRDHLLLPSRHQGLKIWIRIFAACNGLLPLTVPVVKISGVVTFDWGGVCPTLSIVRLGFCWGTNVDTGRGKETRGGVLAT